MEEITIDSWDVFNHLIHDLDGDWIFRGQSNSSWPLETSFSRFVSEIRKLDGISISPVKLYECELDIINEFKRVSPLFLNDSVTSDVLENLCVMQHYGTPTRLLDFTCSPYIALFFAISEGVSEAAVFFLKPSTLIELNGSDSIEQSEIENIFGENEKSQIILYSPAWTSERLHSQQGLFLLPARLDKTFSQILSGYLLDKYSLLKVIIPKALRLDGVRMLLDMNISSGSLFPGLEGFCSSLKNLLIHGANTTARHRLESLTGIFRQTPLTLRR